MIEILHLNTLQCLLPRAKISNSNNGNTNEDEKKNENENENDMDYTPLAEEYIGAKYRCKGNMIVISFHLLSQDEIRCYLYVDGKYMRIKIGDNANESDDLEALLGFYIDSESYKRDGDEYNPRGDESKYNDFAFNTHDQQFDEDFKWTQTAYNKIRV